MTFQTKRPKPLGAETFGAAPWMSQMAGEFSGTEASRSSSLRRPGDGCFAKAVA